MVSPSTCEPHPLAADIERPMASPAGPPRFGSDLVAETLRALDIRYVALNPGASFRGLHDSLVNHLGNLRPSLLLCLHEEHAVAIAHGWAKVTGRPMAAALHSNVGLFHGTMAIFNAWCDRMPVIVIGATGPLDATKRRPWIEWIHSARDQGAIIRPYVKWDDQPGSAGAAREALLRGAWLAGTAPMGPVYINLDVELQEAELATVPAALETSRYVPVTASAAPVALIREAVEVLRGAERPVLLAGRVSRSLDAWHDRIALAEQLGAKVVTDLKVGAAFPTTHFLHAGAPGVYLVPDALAALREADAILSLDWVDLAGTLKAAFGEGAVPPVVQVSLDHQLHNGWSFDHQGLPPVDLMLTAEPDAVATEMLRLLGRPFAPSSPVSKPAVPDPDFTAGEISVEELALALRHATNGRDVSLLHLPLSWNGASWPLEHPLDFLGSDGGGGIGGGPGIAVGVALALRDTNSGRLPIAICGDGDFVMGATALWTAAHYRIPLLIVVANNQSFYNDEVHQERVARLRGRPVENKWIGQRMSDPDIDIAGLARAQGAVGFGPVADRPELVATFREAIEAVEQGGTVVVDIRVRPGYTPAFSAALTRGTA